MTATDSCLSEEDEKRMNDEIDKRLREELEVGRAAGLRDAADMMEALSHGLKFPISRDVLLASSVILRNQATALEEKLYGKSIELKVHCDSGVLGNS